MAVFSLLPYLAVALWPDYRGIGYLCALIFVHGVAMGASKALGFGMAPSLGLPVAVATMIFTMWRSAFFTIKRQGVRWRDTFYPLSVLREHVY
jgi:hypothetical protein